MSDTGTTAPASSGVGDPATGTTAAANVKYATTEDFDGFKSFLNKDLAGHRKELGNLASKVNSIAELLESLKPATAATGTGKTDKDLPTAELERKVKILEERDAEKERRLAEKTITASINEVIATASPEARKGLQMALRSVAKVQTVNGEDVVVVDGEDGNPVRLDVEWVRKNLGDFYFPAAGKPGTGLTGGGAAGGNSGVDLERGLRDQKYWNEHEPELLKEMARVRGS